MSTNLQRLTLYALITAIEDDARRITVRHAYAGEPLKSIFPEDDIARIIGRYNRDQDRSPEATDEVLLSYADLGDVMHAIQRGRQRIDPKLSKFFSDNAKILEKLISIRNRVMHARPLQFDDLPLTTSFCQQASRYFPDIWTSTKEQMRLIEHNPGHLLSIDTSKIYAPSDKVLHNLPAPEFDDTGFIGREKLRDRILHALKRGRYPVTLLGEGGIGKTALALQAAYDLVDDAECPFEAVIWVTAKTHALTPKEIRRIDGAITETIGLLELAADVVSEERSSAGYVRIISHMEDFPILLILDNMETVLDDSLRDFIRNIPGKSKVLLTSRVSVGAYDDPITLTPLTASESERLLRASAQNADLDYVARMSSAELRGWADRLNNSPLFIRWFVGSLKIGKTPEHLFANTQGILAFCLDNVYSHLTRDAKRVLQVMVYSSDLYTIPVLCFLTELGPAEVQQCLVQLLSANLIEMGSRELGAVRVSEFSVKDLAKSYVKRVHPASSDALRKVIENSKKLQASKLEAQSVYHIDKYIQQSISIRHPSDIIVRRLLQGAMKSTAQGAHAEALQLCQKANDLDPGYFEVHRVLAHVYFLTKNYAEVITEYERAIELAPTHAPLRLWYGGFLWRSMQNFADARLHLDEGSKFDPEARQFEAELARLCLAERNFDGAESYIRVLMKGIQREGLESRKVVNIYLDYFCDFAAARAEEKRFEESLELLQKLADNYRKLPSTLIDNYIMRTIRSGSILSKTISNKLRGTSFSTEADTLSWEFQKFLGLYFEPEDNFGSAETPRFGRGRIERIFPDKGFGFISKDEGGDIYFTRSSLNDTSIWGKSLIGEEVQFSFGRNKKGDCAVDISLV